MTIVGHPFTMALRLKTCRTMWVSFAATVTFLALSFIPARLAVAYLQFPIPEAILMLGGGTEREEFTAQFAQYHPNLDVWVSSGAPTHVAQDIFREANIADERVHIDRRAIDTVTNFTSLVNDFKDQDIHHIYLITSDYHMRRARAIAFFVMGSQGITFTPVTIPSHHSDEPLFKVARDVGRSLLWIATGRTGARFHPQLRP